MSFGERLSELRERNSLTQKELAQLTNISRSRLSLYEINKREPDLATIRQLANFFNVTIDYLAGDTNITSSSLSSKEKSPVNLNKILNEPNLLWHGIPLSNEDKAKLKATLDIIFWNAKQK